MGLFTTWMLKRDVAAMDRKRAKGSPLRMAYVAQEKSIFGWKDAKIFKTKKLAVSYLGPPSNWNGRYRIIKQRVPEAWIRTR